MIVRKLRKEMKMTQQELANKAGVTQKYISLIELNDRIPSVKVLSKIANALDTTMDELVAQINDTEYHTKSPSSIGA